ncbi:MAG TPA: PAS domain-containing protein, partial [Gemmatimonadaceae bacterium]
MPTSLTPEGQQRFLRKLNRAFWTGMGAVVGVGLTLALLAWLNHRSVALILESQTIARLARESKALTVDRATSINGYLLSHQDVSLVPELTARAPLKAKIDSLLLLSRGNASQQDRARSIRSAIVRWERGWVIPALAADSDSRADLGREMLAGKELFDSIRAAFDSFLAGQQRIYAARVTALGALQKFSTGAAILEGVLLLAVLMWMRARAITQAKLLLEQQSQLQSQSLDLQQQAAELEEQAMELEEQADEANRNANELAESNARLQETVRELEQTRVVATSAASKGELTESLLNVLLDNAPVGVILWNSRREVVRVNPALEAMTGFSDGNTLGRRIEDLASDEIVEIVEPILEEVLETGNTVLNVPLTGTNKVDPIRERHFLGSYFPVTLPGNERGVGGVVLETTQFRQLEEQLLQSQKM